MQENSDSKSFQTLSGIDLNNVYGQKDLEGFDSSNSLGSPGEYPFTRGAYPSMYRERLWTRRQIAGFGTAEATNQRYQFLLSRGQTGLSTDFDHPNPYRPGLGPRVSRRRSGPAWRGRGHPGGHARPFPGHQTRRCQRFHDHQPPGHRDVVHVPGGGTEQGPILAGAAGHGAERFFERVLRPKNLRSSSRGPR